MSRGVPRCAGFTLIEVLVALVVGTVTVLLGHAVCGDLVLNHRTLRDGRHRFERDQNVEEWIREMFESLAIGSPGDGGFDGSSTQVAFDAWVRTPRGFAERQRIVIGYQGTTLSGAMGGAKLVLNGDLSSARFEYLVTPGADSKWVPQWTSPSSAPVAVRLHRGVVGLSGRVTADTTIILIKERS